MISALDPCKSTAQAITHKAKLLEFRPSCSRALPPEGNDTSSCASTFTTVIEDRRNSSLAEEVGFRGTVFLLWHSCLISPANAHFNLPGVTSAPSNNPRGEFPKVYRTPYPLLPSQIGPRGGIARPFSASFLPTLSPYSGSADVTFPGITSNLPPVPHLRFNSQQNHSRVYYPSIYQWNHWDMLD